MSWRGLWADGHSCEWDGSQETIEQENHGRFGTRVWEGTAFGLGFIVGCGSRRVGFCDTLLHTPVAFELLGLGKLDLVYLCSLADWLCGKSDLVASRS